MLLSRQQNDSLSAFFPVIMNSLFTFIRHLLQPRIEVRGLSLISEKTIILATAHPAKFSDTVMKETNIKPELPESLKSILSKKENCEKLPKDLKKVKNYILKQI